MEPETKEFLKRVMYSLFAFLFWLIINSTAGIMYNLAFIENKISIGNILFYLWLIISFFLLFKIYKYLWKKKAEK